MQPEELYFHGSMARYWNVICAEYKRLCASLGREPFEIIAPNPKQIASAGYMPGDSDPILIAFWDDNQEQEVLSVDAEYSRHEQAVWVMAHDHGAQVNRAHSAFYCWKQVKLALGKDEAAHQRTGKKRGPQPRTVRSIDKLHSIRMEAIVNNRAIPTKEIAMAEAEITYKSWKRYAPQLLHRWYEKDYRPENLE